MPSARFMITVLLAPTCLAFTTAEPAAAGARRCASQAQQLAQQPAQQSPRDRPAEDRDAETPSAEEKPASHPAPQIELIKPGSEPRAVVRYAPAEDAVEHVLMTVDMTTEQTAMGMNTPPTTVPRTQATFRITIDAVGPGEFRYEAVLNQLEVLATPDSPPGMAERLRRVLGGLEGMMINVTATDRGVVQQVDVTGRHGPAPTALDNRPSLQRAFTEAIVPLPEEAIGAGARWKAVSRIDADGIEVEQTTTYSLERIDGDDYVLDVTVTQTAEEQEIRVAKLPGRMKLQLVDYSTEGTGGMIVRSGRIIPVTGDVRTTTMLNSRIDPNNITMDQKVEARTRFDPVEPPEDAPQDAPQDSSEGSPKQEKTPAGGANP